MKNPKDKSIAMLVGYNKKGEIVYSEELSLDNYYDGEHIWDSPETVKKAKIVKLHGKLYNFDGVIEQEFENVYSEMTGDYMGGISKFEDGTVVKDGIYE